MRRRLTKPRYWWSSLVLSLIFTGIHCLYCFTASAELHPQTEITGTWLRLLMLPASFAALLILFNGADLSIKRGRQPELVSEGAMSWRFAWLRCFAVIILFWLPYYIMCFPGNMFYDTGVSILYDLGIDRSNVNNPFFQNLVMGGAYRFGAMLGDPKTGIAVYVSLQFLSYALLLSYALCRIQGNRVFRYMALLLYALLPVFPIYALSMGKDTNFALPVLLNACLALELVQDTEGFMRSRMKRILMAASLLLMGLFRNHAVYVPAAALLLYAFAAGKNRGLKRYAACVSAGAVLLCALLPALTGAPAAEVRESLSLPLQQTGFYMTRYPYEVTQEESELISEVVPLEAVQQYNSANSDPIKSRFLPNPSTSQLTGYFKAWRSQLQKHPLGALKAAYLQTYAYYTPLADRTDVKPHTTVGFDLSGQVLDETELTYNTNEYLGTVISIDKISMQIPVYGALSRIGIYTWLLIIAAVRVLQKRQYRYLTAFAPAVMILAGCLLSPINGYYRYAFPMILCVPVLFTSSMQLGAAEKEAAREKAVKTQGRHAGRLIQKLMKAAVMTAVPVLLAMGILSLLHGTVEQSTVYPEEGVFYLSPAADPSLYLTAAAADSAGAAPRLTDQQEEAARIRLSYAGEDKTKVLLHFEQADKNLDVFGGEALKGTMVWTYKENGSPAQQWRILKAAGQEEYCLYYLFELVVTMNPDSGELSLMKKTDSIHQRWRMIPSGQ